MSEIKPVSLSKNCEMTTYPWWGIINPEQIMTNKEPDPIAARITGPFFSRESAEAFLQKTRYNFSKYAVVWCFSGCYSEDWINFTKSMPMIETAPEMCHDLDEAVVEMCHNCPSNTGSGVCDKDKCFVQRWKATLKKARGE